jgi:hypothetical protein
MAASSSGDQREPERGKLQEKQFWDLFAIPGSFWQLLGCSGLSRTSIFPCSSQPLSTWLQAVANSLILFAVVLVTISLCSRWCGLERIEKKREKPAQVFESVCGFIWTGPDPPPPCGERGGRRQSPSASSIGTQFPEGDPNWGRGVRNSGVGAPSLGVVPYRGPHG